MQRRVPVVLVGLSIVVVALHGQASGSDDRTADDAERPEYHLDWDEVAMADAAPVISLSPGASGTCSGHVTTSIRLAAHEVGIKSLTLAPVPDEPCVFRVYATARDAGEAESYAQQVDAAMNASGCCSHEVDPFPDGSVAHDDGLANEDISLNVSCRVADGWAHTGDPDPPTVVYTRVYHAMDFCYDGHDATVDAIEGYCFANQAAGWFTDGDECYWDDYELGPASEVYLSLHGYFEKQINDPFYPFHDMWHTLTGDANGSVRCSGEIVGDFDGSASTHNCGATNPE